MKLILAASGDLKRQNVIQMEQSSGAATNLLRCKAVHHRLWCHRHCTQDFASWGSYAIIQRPTVCPIHILVTHVGKSSELGEDRFFLVFYLPQWGLISWPMPKEMTKHQDLWQSIRLVMCKAKHKCWGCKEVGYKVIRAWNWCGI